MDIDEKHNPSQDWEELKFFLGDRLNTIYYAGLSIGGKGIFLIFKISFPMLYRYHFYYLADFMRQTYLITPDTCCRNISCLRGASYDPNPYYNPEPFSVSRISRIKSGSTLTDPREPKELFFAKKKVEYLIEEMVNDRIDITDDYKDWFSIGCAMASAFGESGRYYFHKISQISNKYFLAECDIQYTKCLRTDRKITLGSFFYICERFGLRYKK